MTGDMFELLSTVSVKGQQSKGYICGRTFPCTTKPALYDVRLQDGQTLTNVSADVFAFVIPPTEEERSRVKVLAAK